MLERTEHDLGVELQTSECSHSTPNLLLASNATSRSKSRFELKRRLQERNKIGMPINLLLLKTSPPPFNCIFEAPRVAPVVSIRFVAASGLLIHTFNAFL